MNKIALSLKASIACDAINGDSFERGVCGRQMNDAYNEINRLELCIAELAAQLAPAPGDPVEEAIDAARLKPRGNKWYHKSGRVEICPSYANEALEKVREAYRTERARLMATAPKVVKMVYGLYQHENAMIGHYKCECGWNANDWDRWPDKPKSCPTCGGRIEGVNA